MYVASSEDYGRDEQSAMVGTEIPRINFQHGCAQNPSFIYFENYLLIQYQIL